MWIKPQQAAQMLSMHPDTLARKVDKGELGISIRRSDKGYRTYLQAHVERAARGESIFTNPLAEQYALEIAEAIDGFEVPLADIAAMFDTNQVLLGEIVSYGASDTDVRDQIFEIVAEFLGEPYPGNGASERTIKKWSQCQDRAALERGWQVHWPVDQSIDWDTVEIEESQDNPEMHIVIEDSQKLTAEDAINRILGGQAF